MRRPVSAKVLFGCLGLALGAATLGSAQAACRQADLAGVWYGMGISGNIVGSYFDISNRCKLQINSTGAVVASGSSCYYTDWTGSGTSNITGGRLSINQYCGITGTITVCEPNGCGTLRVQFAQMERNKLSFPLQGYTVGNNGFRYNLNFVKQ
jgi:hypothetical protein